MEVRVGEGIPYTTGWYENLTLKDLLARLIYGENPYASNLRTDTDRRAIAWVVWNRKTQAGFGGDTLRAVAINPGAFSVITGSESTTNQARNPDTSSAVWTQALSLADSLISAENDNTSFGVARPAGINSQAFFSSYSGFSGFSNKTDVAIAGYSGGITIDSMSTLEEAYKSYMNGYSGAVNIYYTLK